MGTICQTCGGDGFYVALIYCYNCAEFAVHRYCLKVLPKTYEEYVVWLCDDCQKLDLNLDDLVVAPPECNESRDLKSVTSISPEENGLQNLKTAKLTRPRRGSKKKSRKKKMTIGARKVGRGQNERKESSCSTAKTDAQIPESGQLPQGSCSVSYANDEAGNDPNLNPEYKKSNLEEAESAKMLSPLPALDSSNTSMDVDYVPALPIIDPIWRGNLQISEDKGGYSCRIKGHMSRLACVRVSEEAKLFPRTLSSGLHPRLAVWPKGFENCGTRDDSIALYFFPESESDEKVFKSLISEMIRYDLALKAVVTHAELLVFTSTKLPLRLWRFQGKLYLWGVFRQKQDLSETPRPSAAENGLPKPAGSSLASAVTVL